MPYMNTTTHVFGAGCVVFSGRSGNTKLYPILSHPIPVSESNENNFYLIIFIFFLKDYRRIKTQKIYVFNCAELFGYNNFRLGLGRRSIKFFEHVF